MPNRHFQKWTGAYTCCSCGKLTRDTGTGEAPTEHCRLCYWEAVVENATSDYGGAEHVPQAYRDNLAAARAAATTRTTEG